MNIINRIINEAAEPNGGRVFKFMHTDSMGNENLLTVTSNDVRLTIPSSDTPASLSNVSYLLTSEDYARHGYAAGGHQAAKAIIAKAVRDAYHKDSGDGQTILSALKAITKIKNWKLV